MKAFALKCRKMGDDDQTTILVKTQKLIKSSTLKESLRIATITLLSLLVPLSFLLLARVSCASFLQTLANNAIVTESATNLLSASFPFTNPAPLYLLVSVITVSALVKTLSPDKPGTRAPPKPSQARLCASWLALVALQACVDCSVLALGPGLSWRDYSVVHPIGAALSSKLFFFVGLHEATSHWARVVVRPVVDDTLPGARAASEWTRRGALAGALGSLWWWRLRDEVAALVAAAEARGEGFGGRAGVWDFAGWWVYYLTVTVGMVRVVKGLMWLGMALYRARLVININGGDGSSAIVMIVSGTSDHDHDHDHEQEHTCLDVDDDHSSTSSDDEQIIDLIC